MAFFCRCLGAESRQRCSRSSLWVALPQPGWLSELFSCRCSRLLWSSSATPITGSGFEASEAERARLFCPSIRCLCSRCGSGGYRSKHIPKHREIRAVFDPCEERPNAASLGMHRRSKMGSYSCAGPKQRRQQQLAAFVICPDSRTALQRRGNEWGLRLCQIQRDAASS